MFGVRPLLGRAPPDVGFYCGCGEERSSALGVQCSVFDVQQTPVADREHTVSGSYEHVLRQWVTDGGCGSL